MDIIIKNENVETFIGNKNLDMLKDCTFIKIERLISSSLGMNLSAKELFEEINNSPNPNIIIDFTDVFIMGRSFTQEYIYQKMKSEKNVYEENLPEDVRKMFEVVKKDYE